MSQIGIPPQERWNEKIKVLTKMLDLASQNFEGGIHSKKYMAITKTSKATAVRDISQLVTRGYCMPTR